MLSGSSSRLPAASAIEVVVFGLFLLLLGGPSPQLIQWDGNGQLVRLVDDVQQVIAVAGGVTLDQLLRAFSDGLRRLELGLVQRKEHGHLLAGPLVSERRTEPAQVDGNLWFLHAVSSPFR